MMRGLRMIWALSMVPMRGTKRFDRVGAGDAPDHIGLDGQVLVHLAGLVLREMLGGRQIELLDPAIEPLHDLNGPGPTEVQPGPVLRAVISGHVLAQDGHERELARIHGVNR